MEEKQQDNQNQESERASDFEFLQEKIRKPMEEEPDVQVLLEKEKSEVERERK